MENSRLSPAVEPKSPRQVSLSTFIMTLALVLVIGVILGTRSQEFVTAINHVFGTSFTTSNQSIDLSTTQEAYNMIVAKYDGDVSASDLEAGAAHGLTNALGDPHTVFMTASEAEQYQKDLSGSLSGIGAAIGMRNNQPTILRVIANSPADKAGIKAQDVIIKVGDKSTEGMDAYNVAELIRGDAGTDVTIEIKRDGVDKTYTITRAEVTDPSVAGELRGTVGVITIRRFDTDTGALAREQANSLIAKGATSFVLDLRDNGGGYLNQAQSVAGMWLSSELVVTEKHGDIQTDQLYSTGDPLLRGKSTVVLINNNSASASEVVAGALKDHGAATLIGEKSYGKGTVQQIFDLSGGNEIKITIAHWLTPNGNSIDKVGITPDETVELTSADVNKGLDPQLDAAIKKLQ